MVEMSTWTGARARYLCINWYLVLSQSDTGGRGGGRGGRRGEGRGKEEGKKNIKKPSPTVVSTTNCRDVKTQQLFKPVPLQGSTAHFF